MSNQHETFDSVAFAVAKKFLHTVVVVDDQAGYSVNDTPQKVVSPTKFGSPIPEREMSDEASVQRVFE